MLPASNKIRWHHLPSGKGPLGKMRNLALQLSAGSVVMQWDDDDWSHPDRIKRQWETLGDKPLGFLKRLTLFWPAKEEAGITHVRAWECAFIARRDRLSMIYPEIAKAEDSQLFDKLRKSVPYQMLDEPELYVRTVHGANTWEESHFDQFQNHKDYQPLPSDYYKDLHAITNY
jgi:glycosyltransferase involved in cell wall biosynthesis